MFLAMKFFFYFDFFPVETSLRYFSETENKKTWKLHNINK